MTLQASGAISLSQINTELNVSAGATHSLNDADMRLLAGVASGAISLSNFYSKIYRVIISYNITSVTADVVMRTYANTTGWNQTTPCDFTLTVSTYVYASSTGVYAMLTGPTWPANSIIKLVNNGWILGGGGAGAVGTTGVWLSVAAGAAGAAGGPGFGAQYNVSVTNNSWIAAGGGGGGGGGSSLTVFSSSWWSPAGGGGGGGRGGNLAAGGAAANGVYGPSYPIAWSTSGAGGAGALGAGGAGGAGVNAGYGIVSGGGGAGGDVATFKSEATIKNLVNPVQFLAIDATKAYVSDWIGNVAIVDLVSNAISKTIPAGTGPDAMLKSGSYVYVANTGGFSVDSTITVIDFATDKVVKTIKVGDVPSAVVADGNGRIWVLCKGKGYTGWPQAGDTPGRLIRIDPNSLNVDFTYKFASNDIHPEKLVINKQKSMVYFLYNYGVYRFNITLAGASPELIRSRSFYSLDYENKTGYLYVSDPKNYVGSGIVLRLKATDGSVVDSIPAGIIPRGFAFPE